MKDLYCEYFQVQLGNGAYISKSIEKPFMKIMYLFLGSAYFATKMPAATGLTETKQFIHSICLGNKHTRKPANKQTHTINCICIFPGYLIEPAGFLVRSPTSLMLR